MGQFIGFVIGSIIGAAIGSLVLAIFIKLATKWVTKDEMLYGHAYKTAFTATIANMVVFAVLAFGAGMVAGPTGVAFVNLAMLPIGFLIMSGVINLRLDLGFGPAALVTLIAYAMALVFGGLVILGLLGIAALGAAASMA